ncbi:GNAT family N-acetyltransferase [Salipaludibacillus sp. CF4.18]|uniref:GNAT family N-acetyltransferase n=1 Tax=Salipaludibacillus sp. CF4.18 TaxID=3373081 RepID=UPI003EE65D01
MFTYRINNEAYMKLLDMNDALPLFNLIKRSKNLHQWLPWVEGTKEVTDTQQFIRIAMKQYADNNGFQASIWYRGQIAGLIGFHQINWNNRATSIGYWLGEEFEGLGLMTQAGNAMIQYAFRDLHLNRIEIRAAVQNYKSQAIPQRLGFTKEGCIRQFEWLHDHYSDAFVYSLLAEEWATR